MKYILSILAITAGLSACTYNAKDEAVVRQQAITAVKDSLKLDSFKRAEAVRVEEQRIASQVAARVKEKEQRRTLLLSEQNEAAPAPRTYAAETPAKKKGMSSAAKGTLIGAGAGALGGVLLDKKDGRGAIIGGVVGAGTGYLIGRDRDKKSGRVQN